MATSANNHDVTLSSLLDPKETIELFYASLTKGNCQKAISIRSRYSKEQCKVISKVSINALRIELNKESKSVAYINMSYIKNNREKKFIGYFWLMNNGEKWVIQNDFVPLADITYREFVNKYISPISGYNENKIKYKIVDKINSNNHQSKLEYLKSSFSKENNGNIILVDISEQQLFLYSYENELISSYPISSSIKGIGNKKGSDQTPLGAHLVKKKFGDNAELGSIFKARSNTGLIAEIIKDPIDIEEDDVTTRVLWLEGLELGKNKGGDVDSFLRYIYIHGTPEEGLIGTPASHGCIRMYNSDVVNLFNDAPINTLVYIGE